MIFGRWTPLGAFGAALLFAASEALRVAISLSPPTGELGDVLRAIPPEFYGSLPYLVTIVVLVGRRRPERPAGRRRQAVRARSPDLRRDRPMTRAERDRAAAFLDLEEGRGPVPVLDDAGIERVLRATRRIAVIGASANRARPSYGVFRYLVQQGFECVPINPNETDVLGVPAYPTLAAAVAETGRFDMVDVFRRSELCVPHAEEAVATGARVPVAPARRRQLGGSHDRPWRRAWRS